MFLPVFQVVAPDIPELGCVRSDLESVMVNEQELMGYLQSSKAICEHNVTVENVVDHLGWGYRDHIQAGLFVLGSYVW